MMNNSDDCQTPRPGRNGNVPPVEYQFQPGQSGNPKGRPKRMFSSLLRAYLTQNDRALNFISQMHLLAIRGNPTAIRFFLNGMDEMCDDLTPEEQASLDRDVAAFDAHDEKLREYREQEERRRDKAAKEFAARLARGR